MSTLESGNRTKDAIDLMETKLKMNKTDNETMTINSNNSSKKNNETDINNMMSEKSSNNTQNGMFESIDSNQEFRGHVTFKVGNVTYNINFVTGDKSNTREETLTTSGVLYGRFNYLLRNSPTKVVVSVRLRLFTFVIF